MPEARIAELEMAARRIRATCVQMARDGREGHLSSALSCADILVALYYGWLRVTPERVTDANRDRFILSKGHGCTSLYAVLADRGFIPKPWLARYAGENSPLPNHPCMHALDVLEFSSGSLGHGLGVATGMLYGLRMSGSPARAVVLLGDGECNEGSVWEAATFAAANRLRGLLAIVDNNGIQAVGRSDQLAGYTSLAEKFRAFGWDTHEVDGNSIPAVLQALGRFPAADERPTAIIAKTRGGAGVPFMEDDVLWHYRVPSPEDVQQALEHLGARPIHQE
jgi:transketolase